MSEARPYKKTPEKVSEEVDEVRKELHEIKKDAAPQKTIIREEVISPPKPAETKEEPKKKEDKEKLEDVDKDDRYTASAGPEKT